MGRERRWSRGQWDEGLRRAGEFLRPGTGQISLDTEVRGAGSAER